MNKSASSHAWWVTLSTLFAMAAALECTFESGPLATPLALTGVSSPSSLRLADLNGDARVDVVFSGGSGGSSFVSWARSLGTGSPGTFASAIVIGTFTTDCLVADIGDLTGSGVARDVLVTCGDGSVVYFANNGAGAFVRRTVTSASVGAIFSAAIGAFSGRLRALDVIVSRQLQSPLVFRNNGTGGFALAALALTSAGVNCNVGALMDASTNASRMVIFSADVTNGFGYRLPLTNGSLDYGPRVFATALTGGQTVVALYVHDLDSDGDADAVIQLTDELKMAKQVRPGVFVSSVIGPLSDADTSLVDVNGDGALDVLFASSSSLFADLNSGAATFTRVFLGTVATFTGNCQAGSLNAHVDSAPDIVCTQLSMARIAWFPSTTAISSDAAPLAIVAGEAEPFLALGRVTSDLILDVVFLDRLSLTLLLLVGEGNGQFAAPVAVAAVLIRSPLVALLDLDSSGTDDLVAADQDRLRVWLSNGLVLTESSVLRELQGEDLEVAQLADLNDDSLVDVMYIGSSVLYFALGVPSVSPLVFGDTVTVGSLPNMVVLSALADLSGDARAEFVTGDETGAVTVWLQSGPSTAPVFSPTTVFTVGGAVKSLALGPLTTATGRVDMLVSDSLATVTVLQNVGSAIFTSLPVAVATGGGVVQLALFTGDALLDMIFVNASNRVWYAPGNGLGSFVLPPVALPSALPITPSRLLVADFSLDGFADVIVFSSTSSTAYYIKARPPASMAPPTASALSRDACAARTKGYGCLLRALAAAPVCWKSSLALAPGNYSACLTGTHAVLDRRVAITGAGAQGANATRLTCRPGGTQAFLELAGNAAALALSSLALVAEPASTALAPTPLAIAGAGLLPNSLIRLIGDRFGQGATLAVRNVTLSGHQYATALALASFDTSFGGVVAAFGPASVTFVNVTVLDSRAPLAGGVIAMLGDDSQLTVTDSLFRNSIASGAHADALGGGGGGALAIYGARVAATFTRVTMAASSAPLGSGGAVLVMPTAEHATLVLADTTVVDSTAGVAGGAIALVGATGARVDLTGSTLVAHSRALWGGAFAAMSSELAGALFPTTLSSAALPAAAQSPSALPGASLTVSSTRVRLGASSAAFGGAVLACGAVVDLGAASWAALAPGESLTASVAGGLVFTCLSGQPADVPAAAWFTPPADASALVSSAALYGPLRASPPSVFAATAVPTSVSSGVPLGAGLVTLVDIYGQRVVDPTVAVRLDLAPGASLALSTNPLVVLPAPGTGDYALNAVTLALTDWPGSLASVASLLAVVEGAGGASTVPGLPSVTLSVRVDGCTAGWGRVSAPLASTPLVCARCADDAFSSAAAAAAGDSCAVCPANARTVAPLNTTSDARVCVCLPGFAAPDGAVNVACSACPAGAQCAGGTAAPTAAPGFYPDTSGGTTVFVACVNADACLAGGTCARSYSGRLCGKCARGYYSLNGRCLACNNVRTSALTAVLVLAAVALVAALLWFNVASSASHKFVAAMIGLTALQIAALYGKLEFDWGPFATVFFRIASVLAVNVELASPECSLARGVDAWALKFALSMALPLIAAAAVLLVTMAVFAPLAAAKVGRLASLTRAALADGALRTWYQLMVILYLPLTAAAFSVFACRRDAAGRAIWLADPSRECYDTRWWRFFAPGLIFSAAYGLAAPLTVMALVRRARTRLDEPTFVLRYGFLVARFVSARWYYEAVVMALKLGVVASMTFFQTDTGRAAGAILALAGSMIHQASVRPYRRELHNVLALAAQGAITLVLFGGTFVDTLFRRVAVATGVVAILLVIVVGNLIDIYRYAREDAAATGAWAGKSSRRDSDVFDDTAISLRTVGLSVNADDGGSSGPTTIQLSAPASLDLEHEPVPSLDGTLVLHPPPLPPRTSGV